MPPWHAGSARTSIARNGVQIREDTFGEITFHLRSEHRGTRLVTSFAERLGRGQVTEPPVVIPEIERVAEGRFVANTQRDLAEQLDRSRPQHRVLDAEKPYRDTYQVSSTRGFCSVPRKLGRPIQPRFARRLDPLFAEPQCRVAGPTERARGLQNPVAQQYPKLAEVSRLRVRL